MTKSLGSMEAINLVTNHGDFDVTLHPSGVSTFSEWDRQAEDTEALGVHFWLASLADIIQSKDVAGRPKDRIALPIRRELLSCQKRKYESARAAAQHIPATRLTALVL